MHFIVLFFITCLAQSNSEIYNAEMFPAGKGTTKDFSKQAFNHPLTTASFTDKKSFGVGNSFFKRPWVEYPSSTSGQDGLGPTYNAIACAACHVNDGKGVGYIKDKVNLSMLFRISDLDGHPLVDYGDQFQPLGIANVQGEGEVEVEFTTITGTYDDGEVYELRRPHFQFKNLKASAFDENVAISPRVAPHMVGLGLIEAIREKSILRLEDPDDTNQDGISGRANWVYDKILQKNVVGRFGWKLGQPNLRQQNAAAFIGDMGLTTSLFPEQNCPPAQLDCLAALSDPEWEVSEVILDRVTLYTQLISVPEARNVGTVPYENGKAHFHNLKCAACHTPVMQTGEFHEVEALRDEFIWPFSDFLLHDMGEDLADHRPEAMANGFEWRTAPLWSIGLVKTVNNHTNLLHDGRARNVAEAILWHGGEAENSKNGFKKLNKTERDELIFFVNSI